MSTCFCIISCNTLLTLIKFVQLINIPETSADTPSSISRANVRNRILFSGISDSFYSAKYGTNLEYKKQSIHHIHTRNSHPPSLIVCPTPASLNVYLLNHLHLRVPKELNTRPLLARFSPILAFTLTDIGIHFTGLIKNE